MSGGVDSSVAAAMLRREGHEVVGCFMRLGSPGETIDAMVPGDEACPILNATGPVKIGHQGCCSITDAADARMFAAELDIPFYVCNFKKDFGRIIDYFVDEYANGRTPNPCVRCNDWLKFGKLREYAQQIGADVVASGHYARAIDGRLLRGIDGSKDQSYVLFGVPREHLNHMMLPVGGFEKGRIREMAKEWGLPVFDKPDSQEICFVPDNDYAGLVERKRPGLREQRGSLVTVDGKVVGEHSGQHQFTIGQRRGLDLALGYRIYVVDKDASTNTVVVGGGDDLLSRGVVANEANWLIDPPSEWRDVMVKYRYNTPAVRGRVRGIEQGEQGGATPSGRVGRFEVEFAEQQSAVAPGQAVVVYDGAETDWVLGGGWIERVVK